MKKTLLFTIIMALLCLASPMSAQKDIKPDGNGKLDFKSDNVTMWIWNGSVSSAWMTPDNWTTDDSNIIAPSSSSTGKMVPGVGDKVYIPKLSSGHYPNINGMTCDEIYIAAGAMVQGQYGANINEWYTDVVIPTNEWVLVSFPLQGTYSGDLFTYLQGGKYTDAFDSSIYQPEDNGGRVKNGSEGPNRVFPSSVYQRLFSTFASSRTDAGYYIEPESFESEWSTPTNALATQYQIAQGLQIYAEDNNNNTNADFHFPSEETTYHYFTTAGNQHQFNETVTRSGKKPAYNGANGTMNVTVTRNLSHASSDLSDVPPTFAVGNPAFARMSIADFLRKNFSNGNTAPYLYKSDNEVYGLDGGDLYKATPTDYFNNPTINNNQPADNYIERDRGFLVMAGDDKVKPIEPKLIGTYNMTYRFYSNRDGDPQDISWSVSGTASGTWNLLWVIPISYNYSLEGNGNISPIDHEIKISETTDANQVSISGFAGLGEVLADVDNVNHKIRIPKDAFVSNFIDNNQNTHPMYLTPSTDAHMDGSSLSDDAFTQVSDQNNIDQHILTTKTVTIDNPADSLWISYTINPDNTVSLVADNYFTVYPHNAAVYSGYLQAGDIYGTGSIFNRKYHQPNEIGSFKSSTWNIFDYYTGSKPSSDIKEFDQDENITASKDKIDLTFTPEMFDAPVTIPAPAPTQKGPRKTAALGSTIASVNANYNNYNVNTFIKRNNSASNGYKRSEDAALFDLNNEVFTLASLSGSQVVAINTINDTTAAQLYLTGVNGNVELVFDNLEALGENVRLFDANDSTERPLNGNHDNMTVNFGVNDSPLRYSLVWDYTPIISGNETLVDLDFTVFSPAKGEVKVMSGDMMNNVRLYNAAGQLVKSIAANSNDASFSALLPGFYVVEIYTSNGRGTKKVDVK